VTIVAELDEVARHGDRAGTRRPLVLMPDLTGEGERVSAAIAFAQAQAGRAFLLYVADTIAPAAYKELVRTGAAEWTTWEALPAELRDVAGRWLAGPRRTGSPRS
jgi:hypothetical protein